MFTALFVRTIVTFFILNTDIANKKKMYKGDHKKFYVDMFRMFYLLLLVTFVLAILATENNIDMISKYIPTPKLMEKI